MKIPEKFIPLGPESAFKMPEGEFLPMWARKNLSCDYDVVAISNFDGKRCYTFHGFEREHCMPMEGHPIPEFALLKKPDRPMTWREVAELLGRYRWGEAVCAYKYSHSVTYDAWDKEVTFVGQLRKWDTDELVAPMLSLLEAARKEAGN